MTKEELKQKIGKIIATSYHHDAVIRELNITNLHTRHEKVMHLVSRQTDSVYDLFEEYAQSIVLGKLPGDDEIDDKAISICKENFPDQSDITLETEIYSFGAEWMRSIATQSIRTEDEVTKPYRELLRNINCKLAMLEERIHGEDGDIITYTRGDINNILYRKNASTN